VHTREAPGAPLRRVEGPARAERCEDAPEQQAAQQLVAAIGQEVVPRLQRVREDPRGERREPRVPADAERERRSGGEDEERAREARRAREHVE
jgi:hypothetical protein